jgi:hypothetical protein
MECRLLGNPAIVLFGCASAKRLGDDRRRRCLAHFGESAQRQFRSRCHVGPQSANRKLDGINGHGYDLRCARDRHNGHHGNRDSYLHHLSEAVRVAKDHDRASPRHRYDFSSLGQYQRRIQRSCDRDRRDRAI